ncbi:hypothetical protein L226DRAFT_527194 [Lentinus tigrinus ALCF2SS1-7]|uniref:Uncharacterized protein n=1 Tax=Lentinus tigrinus ALCF2SS1-6 TaxID=1328759 RepID=A0A5C2RXG5_9APHY|nr:hypothetical protein L227DRAFT_588417 [Lentinus tigrinus ALCF2SS1-6]RPD68537.1 hypothetical protein L226DRAFT_527194 [Lentinus tigrinus ALCF2SS1-7]
MAAAAAPSHRIHSIHGAFGGPSRYGPSSPFSMNMNPAQASWNRIPNVCAPRRTYEVAPAARTTPASVSASCSGSSAGSTGLGMRSAAGSRPRRTTISTGSWGSPIPSRRPPPPPPAPAERTTSALQTSLSATPVIPTPVPIPEIDDPFADAHEDLSPFPPPSPRTISSRTRVAVSVSSCTMSTPDSDSGASLTVPPGLGSAITIPSAKDMRGRLVATTLLNRGSGRPLGVYLRRRLSGEGTTYVKSGLSQLVAAAA